jgi:hypothetical protein
MNMAYSCPNTVFNVGTTAAFMVHNTENLRM